MILVRLSIKQYILLMILKITSAFSSRQSLKTISIFLLMLSVLFGFGQTVTEISPTIVTQGSIITITGTGFNNSIDESIDINNGDIGIINKKYINSTTMTFEINSSLTSDRHGFLFIKNYGGVSFNTGFSIKYLAPTQKVLGNNTANITRISEIFTDWNRGNGNTFWRSSEWSNSDKTTWPNNHHNLLAFTYGEGVNKVIYSTGVNGNQELIDRDIDFTAQNFKAYSSNGVQGKVNRNHYLQYGDAIDGVIANSADGNLPNGEPETITSPEVLNATIYNSIVDGVNGLDLGTGITNFNKDVSVRFFSGNGQVGALDEVPDLLITQIADASDSSKDIYYYADVDGNVVGRPIALNIRKDNNSPGPAMLAKWIIDLYRFQNGLSFDNAVPTVFATDQNDVKTIKMAAFKLQEFGILNAATLDSVNNINMAAGGNADIAFLAYNKAAFDIKSPDVERFPVSQFVCRLNGETDIEFNAIAKVDGIAPGEELSENEELSYAWYKFNNATGDNGAMVPYSEDAILNIDNVVAEDLGLYKLEISNFFGKIILPVSIQEGGTPAIWNGVDSFDLPNVYIEAGITVAPGNRNLIFANGYNHPGNINNTIEGCDCRVPAGENAIIPAESTLKLYDEITVEPAVDILDVDTGAVVSTIPAGVITFENNASLVQTKPTSTNENIGKIKMKRNVNGLNSSDYIYWSSPVAGFNISNIPGNLTYYWDTNFYNSGTNTYGNWIVPTGPTAIMAAAQGYIKRVPSASSSITTEFNGVPNNGLISINVVKTSGANPMDTADRNWNLLGNPYPSAINAEAFLLENTRLEGTVRLWTHTSGLSSLNSSPFYQNFANNYADQYITQNGTGVTPAINFDGNIASGQGFFVRVEETQSAGTVLFKNRMRFTDNLDGNADPDPDADSEIIYDNSQFFRNAGVQSSNENLEKQLVWLSIVDTNDMSASTLIGYVDGATYEKDRMYDARTDGADFSIYSLISEDQMLIQGRPLPFADSDLVPLGVNLSEAGIYEIAIDKLQGSIFVENQQGIYIEDIYQNTIHNLREAPYTFTGTVGTINDRFILRYTNNEDTLSAIDLATTETFAFIKNNVLHVQSSQNIKDVTVYDLTGKTIAEFNSNQSRDRFESDFNFSRSVYLAVITLENGTLVKKKLMN